MKRAIEFLSTKYEFVMNLWDNLIGLGLIWKFWVEGRACRLFGAKKSPNSGLILQTHIPN